MNEMRWSPKRKFHFDNKQENKYISAKQIFFVPMPDDIPYIFGLNVFVFVVDGRMIYIWEVLDLINSPFEFLLLVLFFVVTQAGK